MKEQFHVTISKDLKELYPYYPFVIDIYNKCWSNKNTLRNSGQASWKLDDSKWIDDEVSENNPLDSRGIDIWRIDPDETVKN